MATPPDDMNGDGGRDVSAFKLSSFKLSGVCDGDGGVWDRRLRSNVRGLVSLSVLLVPFMQMASHLGLRPKWKGAAHASGIRGDVCYGYVPLPGLLDNTTTKFIVRPKPVVTVNRRNSNTAAHSCSERCLLLFLSRCQPHIL